MPTKKQAAPKDKLNRLLSKATAQFNTTHLANASDAVDYSPDALYNRFMLAFQDLKGHYASGYGEYGRSLGLGVSTNITDFVMPGLSEMVKLTAGLSVSAEASNYRLLLIHRHLPALIPDFSSNKPLGLFVLRGKRLTSTANATITIKTLDILPETLTDQLDVLNTTLKLSFTGTESVSATLTHKRLCDPNPRHYVSSLSDDIKEVFRREIGVPTKKEVSDEIHAWYSNVLELLKGALKAKQLANKDSLMQLDQIAYAAQEVKTIIDGGSTNSWLPLNIKQNLDKLKQKLSKKDVPTTAALDIFNALSYFKAWKKYSTVPLSFVGKLRAILNTTSIITNQYPKLPAPLLRDFNGKELISRQQLDLLNDLKNNISAVQLDTLQKNEATLTPTVMTALQAPFTAINSALQVDKRAGAVSKDTIENIIASFYELLSEKFTNAAADKSARRIDLKNAGGAIKAILKLLQIMKPNPSPIKWIKNKISAPKSGTPKEDEKKDSLPDQLKKWFSDRKDDTLSADKEEAAELAKERKALLSRIQASEKMLDYDGPPIYRALNKFTAYLAKPITPKKDYLVRITITEAKDLNALIKNLELFLDNPYWKALLVQSGKDFAQLKGGLDWEKERLAKAVEWMPPLKKSSDDSGDPRTCRLDYTSFGITNIASLQATAKVKVNSIPLAAGTFKGSLGLQAVAKYHSFRYQTFGFLDQRPNEKFFQTQDTLVKQKELFIPISANGKTKIPKLKANTGGKYKPYTQITYKAVTANWFGNRPKYLQKGSGLIYGCSLELGRLRTISNELKKSNGSTASLPKDDFTLVKTLALQLRVTTQELTTTLMELNESFGVDKKMWDTELVLLESAYAFDLSKINPLTTDSNENAVGPNAQDMLNHTAIKAYRTYLSTKAQAAQGISTSTSANENANVGYLQAIHIRLLLAKSDDRSKILLGKNLPATLNILPDTVSLQYGKFDCAGLESVINLGSHFFEVGGQTTAEHYDHAVAPLVYLHQLREILSPTAAGSQDQAATS